MSITTSPTIAAIGAALLAFQGAVDGVGKTAENTAFKKAGSVFKYATLENVRDTAVPELQKVGVVFLQSGGAIVDGVMAMTTRLIHAESGEWIEGTMDIALGKRDPQGVGSAQTYAQRYHLMAMLGLPPVDDDGEAAIDRNNSRPVQADPRHIEAIDSAITPVTLQAVFGEAWRSTTDTSVRATYKAHYEARKQYVDKPDAMTKYLDGLQTEGAAQ